MPYNDDDLNELAEVCEIKLLIYANMAYPMA